MIKEKDKISLLTNRLILDNVLAYYFGEKPHEVISKHSNDHLYEVLYGL